MSKTPPAVRRFLANQLKKARAAKAAKAKQKPKVVNQNGKLPTDVKIAADALRRALDRNNL